MQVDGDTQSGWTYLFAQHAESGEVAKQIEQAKLAGGEWRLGFPILPAKGAERMRATDYLRFRARRRAELTGPRQEVRIRRRPGSGRLRGRLESVDMEDLPGAAAWRWLPQVPTTPVEM